MRLFIALQFDDNILDALTGFQDDLKNKGVTGNFTRRENLHITLAFIGDYGNPDKVLDVLEQVEFDPVEISLGGVGSFRDIFWAGIKDSPELAGYVRRLRRELSAQGIPYDKKKFAPHITLIRKASYIGGGNIPVDDPPAGNMTATRAVLMKSERGKRGMIYTELG